MLGFVFFQNLMVWKTDNLNKVFKTIVGAHMDWINGISWSDTNDLFVSTIFMGFFKLAHWYLIFVAGQQ